MTDFTIIFQIFRRVRAASRFRDNLGKRSSNSTLRRINSTPVGSTAMMSARTNVTNNDLTALLSPARGGTRRPPSFTNLCLENGQEVPMFVASGTEVHSLNAQDAKRGSMAIRPQAASNVTPRSRLSTMKEKGSPRMKRRKIYTGTSTGWNYFEIGVDASTEAGSSLFSVWNWKPFWNPLTEIKNVSPFMELSKKIVELMNRVASFYEFHAQPKIRLVNAKQNFQRTIKMCIYFKTRSAMQSNMQMSVVCLLTSLIPSLTTADRHLFNLNLINDNNC